MHPAARAGWDDFVDAVVQRLRGGLLPRTPEGFTQSQVTGLARRVVDAHLERTAIPRRDSAQLLADRLIDDIGAVVGPGARIEIGHTLYNMAWEAVRNAMRGSIDYAAAVMVRGAAVEAGEIRTSDPSVSGEPVVPMLAKDDDLIDWLLDGGARGAGHHFDVVARGLAEAATNDAARDAVPLALRDEPLSFPRPPEDEQELLQRGRELLTDHYREELQQARREVARRFNTPVRDDGAGPSGLHDGSAATRAFHDSDDDSDDDLRHADSPRLPRIARLPRDEEGNVIDEDEGSDYEEDEEAVDQRWIDFYVERSQRARAAERDRRP